MGIFAGAENARTSDRNPYIPDGVHLVKVLSCRSGQSEMEGYAYVVVNVEVIETSSTYPPGTILSWFNPIKKNHPGLGNFAQFVATATEADVKEVNEEVCEYACSGKQPLAGKIMKAVGAPIKTKSGGDFTKVTWVLVK